jgi:hypothetical protein
MLYCIVFPSTTTTTTAFSTGQKNKIKSNKEIKKGV